MSLLRNHFKYQKKYNPAIIKYDTPIVNEGIIIIKLDGVSFTRERIRKLSKQDLVSFNNVMARTCQLLCGELPGIVLGYSHTDEIDLISTASKSLFYSYRVQKICSIVTSKATFFFYKSILESNNQVLIRIFDKPFFDLKVYSFIPSALEDYLKWKQNSTIQYYTDRKLDWIDYGTFIYKENKSYVTLNSIIISGYKPLHRIVFDDLKKRISILSIKNKIKR